MHAMLGEDPDQEERLRILNNKYLSIEYPENAEISIHVPIEELQDSKDDQWVLCKGYIGRTKLDCAVGCGHWHKLQFTSQELETGTVNIVDHFSELLSNTKVISLITYQNGIQNSLEDFKKMGGLIYTKLPERPLCIGLYNTTYGLTNDLGRLAQTIDGYLTRIICCTRVMINTFTKLFLKSHPNLLWTHIAHSEGGLIASCVLKQLRFDQELFLRRHLITATYGAVDPIPKRVGLFTLNTYSEDDIAVGFGKKYINNPGYHIEIVKSLVPKKEQPKIEGDHAFSGATYQETLRLNINNIRRNFKIYDAKKS